MPLFDKNDVQIESFPYEIHHNEREAPELACPRCGHVQPRRKRVVCQSCNHLIPTENCRQSWTDLQSTPKDSYRKMAQVFFDDSKTRDFKSARGNFGWKVFIRNVVVTILLAAVLVVPTVLGLKAYLGEKDWKKVEAKFDATVSPLMQRFESRPQVALKPEKSPVIDKKPSTEKKSKHGKHH